MLYVAMTRGRDNNKAFIYQRITGEADHEHSTPWPAPTSTSCGGATNTLPHTTSG